MRRILWTMMAAVMLAAPAAGQPAQQGYVLRVEGRLVFIDLGSQHEVIPNDVFEVVRQETIIHPVTGENLGGEVPLGAIRVVEIFPRLSTAEVVQLEPGVSLTALDSEAKQGLIRVKSAAPDVADEVRRRSTGRRVFVPPRATSTANPDGPLKGIIPELGFGLGSKVQTQLPDRLWKLVGDESLLAMADTTTTDQTFPSINGSMVSAVLIDVPMSRRWTLQGDIRLGAEARLAIGAKVYAGSLFGKSAGLTPDGPVGAPVFTVSVGTGGRGASVLPADLESQLIADAALLAPETFLPDTTANRDSLYQVVITDSLRKEANDSLSAIAGGGLGFSMGLRVPVTRKITCALGLVRFGNVSRISGGVTYYLRPLGEGNANPDGVLRAPILDVAATWDGDAESMLLDLGVTMPLTRIYTAALGVRSDFTGSVRFGVALKGYFRGL